MWGAAFAPRSGHIGPDHNRLQLENRAHPAQKGRTILPLLFFLRETLGRIFQTPSVSIFRVASSSLSWLTHSGASCRTAAIAGLEISITSQSSSARTVAVLFSPVRSDISPKQSPIRSEPT